MERLKCRLLATIQFVLKFIQSLCNSPSFCVFLEAKVLHVGCLVLVLQNASSS